MAIKSRIVFGLCLWVTACTMGPDFTPPENKTPDSWFRNADHAAQTPVEQAKPTDAVWWKNFNDPLLNKLVDQITSANLDIQVATMRIDQSRAQRGIVAADLYPQVDGQASYMRQKESDKGVISLFSGGATGGASVGGAGASSGIPSMEKSPPFNLYQYGFDATWELDLWGRVRRGIEAADAQTQAAEENRRDLTLSVIAELVRDYVQLRGTQADIQTLKENLKTAQEFARINDEKYRGGLGTDLDAANARAQAASVSAQLPQLEQQEASLMNAIALLLSESPGTLERELATPQPIPVMKTALPVGIPSELLKRRPDIRQAEAQLHAATAEIGVAKAQFFPQVSLMGNGALQSLQLNTLNTWAARTYGFGPSVDLPIFEGGRLTSNLKLTEAQQQEAAVTYRKTVLSAFHDVDNALTAYRSALEQQKRLTLAVKQNRQAFALADERYKKGLSDYLDVLSAQRTVLQTQQQLNDSKQAASTATVQLSKALGGGWENQFPDQAK